MQTQLLSPFNTPQSVLILRTPEELADAKAAVIKMRIDRVYARQELQYGPKPIDYMAITREVAQQW